MATIATAQSNDKRNKWERLMGHKNQAAGTQSVETANTAAQDQSRDDFAVTASGDQHAEVVIADDNPKGRLEGTWRVTQSIGTDFSETAFYTFGAGKDANEGVVAFSDQFLFVPNPSCLPGQGVWKRTDGRSFIGTFQGVCFDADNGFIPGGFFKGRSALTLNDQGTVLTGRTHFEGFDVDGNLVFSSDLSLRGVRMQAEAPPHP
jgi:hypothetical protein